MRITVCSVRIKLTEKFRNSIFSFLSSPRKKQKSIKKNVTWFAFLRVDAEVGAENKSTIGWEGEVRNGFVGAALDPVLLTGLWTFACNNNIFTLK